MPDGGDSMALYGEGASQEVTGVSVAVTGACGEATGVDGAATGAAGPGVMTVGKDAPLAVTAVLAQPMLDPPP